MKRSLAALLTTLAIALALWGCDAQNLPTPPAVNTPTQSASTPTATEIADTPMLPTATLPPAITLTPTLSPFTATAVDTSTPTATLTPTSTTEPELGPPTTSPTAEGTPSTHPTRTAIPLGIARTPIAAEDPPSEAWREVVRVAPGKKRIALTFDAGASGETWPRILAALREHSVHITMFITGKFAEQYPDAIKQAVADGHEIANHTYSHPDTRQLTDDQLIEEFSRTEGIIHDLAGVTTLPYWRPPYGARNNHVLNIAAAQGYRSIYWTLDSLDSVGQPKTPDFIFNRVTNTPGVNLDGAIILQHFGSAASADALPRELMRLEEMGLKVVTITELLSP